MSAWSAIFKTSTYQSKHHSSNITIIHTSMLIKAFSSVFAIRKRKFACKERKAGMISHFQEIYPSFQYYNCICKRKHRDIVIELSVWCIETNKGNILSKEEKRAWLAIPRHLAIHSNIIIASLHEHIKI